MKWLMRILGKGKKKKAGFTLIELMVVVIVVGILAAAAVPIYRFAMSRAYSSEAKATMGTIRASELVYYTEQNPNAYLTGVSTDASATDLLLALGVDTTTNTWWHAGLADAADTNCIFAFNLGSAIPVVNLASVGPGANHHVFVIGTGGAGDPCNGIEMALDITTGIWYHYWP